MLKSPDLKRWLHGDFSSREKLLVILASLDKPASLNGIREASKNAGYRIPAKWNMSATLSRSKGQAINIPSGWEISELGRAHLRSLGVSDISPAAIVVAFDLRKHLEKIKVEDTRNFVEEAIKCHEFGLYRSAIVMSWLGAVSVLHGYVHTNRLGDFNTEASRVDTRWKNAVTTDDLGKMNEDKFLDTIERLSIIGKNVKETLKECLKRRNGSGHPNSHKFSTNQSAAHLEALLLNVFEPFS